MLAVGLVEPGDASFPLFFCAVIPVLAGCICQGCLVACLIKTHNSSVINKENNKTPDTCNCRKKEECPLPGKCTIENVIYKAKVTTENAEKRYIGLTATPFKTRYSSHKSSFNNRGKSNQTELSKHIWKLKDEGTPYNIT